MAVPIERRRDLDHVRAALTAEILERQYAGWSGTITLKFDGGKVVDATRLEKIVLPRPGDVASVVR